ncbi:hypothetical protein LOCUS_38200 [Klebsiella pneumoniae]|nr:hypothetical protein LOCUS_38200 [Klebsiella pneumoniae]
MIKNQSNSPLSSSRPNDGSSDCCFFNDITFAVQQSLLPAFGLLLLLGVFGGFFIVPLNALLQERGKHSVGAGNAIAVQNLGENVAMLLMLGLYSLAVSVGVPPVAVGIGFGAVFAVAIAALWVWGRRK